MKTLSIIKRRALILLIIITPAISIMNAQDWPQYYGPNRDAISSQKGIIRSWPQQGPEILWTSNIGIGFGGPVIKDGRVYLLDRDDKVGDKLRCFDFSNGKELWSFNYDAPGSVMFPGSRSVPALDGNYIYTCGPYGNLYCIDINTHKPVWNKNVWKDFGGGEIPRWAITQCPLIYGDLLIVASQAPQAGVVAYEKLTGKVKWTTPSIGAVGYVSPALIKISKADQIVMISAASRGGYGESGGGGKVVGIDPITGKILWEYTNWQCPIPVPGPVDAGDGRILITGGYQAGAAMIKVERKPDGSYTVKELYKNPDFGAHTQQPVLYKDNFYGQYTTNERKDGMVCMSIDGKIRWKTGRAPLFDKGGSIIADGLLICTDGASKLYLIDPDPAQFKPIATADILKADSGDQRFPTQNWAPLALSEGKLLIRDQNKLICVRIAQ
jgi:outer membrane protein assembly factor BamB